MGTISVLAGGAIFILGIAIIVGSGALLPLLAIIGIIALLHEINRGIKGEVIYRHERCLEHPDHIVVKRPDGTTYIPCPVHEAASHGEQIADRAPIAPTRDP